MPKQSPAEDLADALFAFTRAVPWWAGLMVVPATFVLLRWILPGVLALAGSLAGDETVIAGGVATTLGTMSIS